MTQSAQIVVVGGGPAGISAAMAAADAGGQVVLFDEQDQLGGELRHRVAPHQLPGEAAPIRPGELLGRFSARLADSTVEVRSGCLVWGAFDGPLLAVATPAGSIEVAAERVVLATGSTDLALPFPGATLPGVWTARAVQILVNQHRLLPGRRFAVVGGGGEGSEVAGDIRLAGGEVAVVADARSVVAAEGTGVVEAVVVNGERHPVDVVVVAAGRQPDAGLAQMVGCPIAVDPALGGWVPVVDDLQRFDGTPWFVAGNAAGRCDIAVALAEGHVAGLAAAGSLGLVDPAAVDAAAAERDDLLSGRRAARRRAGGRFVQTYQ